MRHEESDHWSGAQGQAHEASAAALEQEVSEVDDWPGRSYTSQHDRVCAAFSHQDAQVPPVVIVDVDPCTPDLKAIPEDYFSDGGFESQLSNGLVRIQSHLAHFDDDFIPFLRPWYGPPVVASALGSQVLFSKANQPAVERPILHRPDQVDGLALPDPYRDGLMPRLLRCIDYFRSHAPYPVSTCTEQGPFNVALTLVGVETLLLWMYDHPNTVHQLMEFCTEVIIRWFKSEKQHAGQGLDWGAFPNSVVLPRGFGGVMLADDDCTIISPALYREFVVPYNSRIFRTFGGGVLHYCGTATHQFENFQRTDGLRGLNVFTLGDFGQIHLAQQMFGDRIALTVCDITAADIEGYFHGLLNAIDLKGVVVATYPQANAALVGRRVAPVTRDAKTVGDEAWSVIRRLLEPYDVTREVPAGSGLTQPVAV